MCNDVVARRCMLTAKHESKYAAAKLSKHDEEELEAEEFRRKKSIAERSAAYHSMIRYHARIVTA